MSMAMVEHTQSDLRPNRYKAVILAQTYSQNLLNLVTLRGFMVAVVDVFALWVYLKRFISATNKIIIEDILKHE